MRCCHGKKKYVVVVAPQLKKSKIKRTEYVSHVFLQFFPAKVLSRKNCEAFAQHTFKIVPWNHFTHSYQTVPACWILLSISTHNIKTWPAFVWILHPAKPWLPKNERWGKTNGTASYYDLSMKVVSLKWWRLTVFSCSHNFNEKLSMVLAVLPQLAVLVVPTFVLLVVNDAW